MLKIREGVYCNTFRITSVANFRALHKPNALQALVYRFTKLNILTMIVTKYLYRYACILCNVCFTNPSKKFVKYYYSLFSKWLSINYLNLF